MIARVLIHIPFNIAIAKDDLKLCASLEYKTGLVIQYFCPFRDPDFGSREDPETLKINEKDAILANYIRIDFKKENLIIGNNYDPSLDLIEQSLNLFLQRLRYVTESPQIHPIFLHSVPWSLIYLNDNGTALKDEKGNRISRGCVPGQLQYVVLNEKSWNKIFTSNINFKSRHWFDLLLDAKNLPRIEPGIVLAFTALEVFIAEILDQSSKGNNISEELWTWINNRPNWQQEPTIEEQYDILLKILTGHSLKEDKKLWSSFQNLKTARNTFVHEGISRNSRKSKKPLKLDEGTKLIESAEKITLKIREWLPNEQQWKIFTENETHNVHFEINLSVPIARPKQNDV
jgi:hypothetical protein